MRAGEHVEQGEAELLAELMIGAERAKKPRKKNDEKRTVKGAGYRRRLLSS